MTTKTIYLFLFLLLSFSNLAAQSLWIEDFENLASPNWSFGEGWTLANGSSANSGHSNLQHKGSERGELLSARYNLINASEITISYVARRSSTYPQAGLRLVASIDGGSSFSITVLDSLEALPESAGSSYTTLQSTVIHQLANQSDVRFKWVAEGGSSSASILRIDDFILYGEGSIPQNRADLSGPSMGFPGESLKIQVDLSLEDAPHGLAGLEFDLLFESEYLTLQDVLLGPALSPSVWTIDNEVDSTGVHVILITQNGGHFANQSREAIVEFVFSPNQVSSTSVQLQTIIGSESTPYGDDPGIRIGTGHHAIDVVAAEAQFFIDTDSLLYGNTRHEEEKEVIFHVSNPGGATSLEVQFSSTLPEIRIEPTSASIEPGDSLAISSFLDARNTEFGLVEEWISISHSGVGGVYDLPIQANILPWRGDSNLDNNVDLVDLVTLIDMIFDRIPIDPLALFSSDNYPFGLEDSHLDVRDLNVLVFALLRETWPDGSILPSLQDKVTANNYHLRSSEVVEPKWIIEEGITRLVFKAESDIRAVYFLGDSNLLDNSNFGTSIHDSKEGKSSIAYKLSGSFTQNDTLSFRTKMLHLSEAIAVDAERNMYPIQTASEVDFPSAEISFDAFPNPSSQSAGQSVQIQLSETSLYPAHITISDVLGRLVAKLETDTSGNATWSPQNVPAGLYLIIVDHGQSRESKLITLTK